MEDMLFDALECLLEYHDERIPIKGMKFEAAEIVHARYVLARATQERDKKERYNKTYTRGI